MNRFKNFINTIPLLGTFFRWVNNILRINNTKHRLINLEQRFLQKNNDLVQKNTDLENKLKNLQTQYTKLDNKFKNQEEFAYDLVRKHIASQLIYFHQKIDTFLENADTTKVNNLKKSITQDFFDEYYLHFENKFRGSRESILKRYEKYLDFIPFSDFESSNIKSLDIGCGRGEWVELLQAKGVQSYGIDMNPMMANIAIQNDLKNIKIIDAFEYLNHCQDNSFDLITAFHIIEHLPFENLVQLLQQIKRVAKPNATILLETPNPQNLQVAACNFYTDPTHLNPLPANMIKFLVEYLGFKDVQINYLNPDISQKEAQDYLIVAKNSVSPYDQEKKLIFDLSLYHRTNIKTGIHRVVSQQLSALQNLNQDDYEIISAYLDRRSNTYQNIDFRHDDILFTSDLSYTDIQNATQNGHYNQLKSKGVKIVFLVHDILPIQYENFFVEGTKQKHQDYIKDITKIADMIITTTQVGKIDLLNYCQEQNIIPPKITTVHLGADISPNISTKKRSKNNHQPTFLMVGTIEPRKAHKQVLESFNLLWQKNPKDKAILIIIGKKGWLSDDLITSIQKHPLLNKNLFFLEKADDETLIDNYTKSDAIIVASYAEGFGLPLIEAMDQNKNIIARDIPVFHEIAGEYPYYFKNTQDPKDIVTVIEDFITQQKPKNLIELKKQSQFLTWEKHAQLLLQKLSTEI